MTRPNVSTHYPQENRWRRALWYGMLPIDCRRRSMSPAPELAKSAHAAIQRHQAANLLALHTKSYPRDWQYKDKYGTELKDDALYTGPNGGEYLMLVPGAWLSTLIQRKSKKGTPTRKPKPVLISNRLIRLGSYVSFFARKKDSGVDSYYVSKLKGGPAFMKVNNS